MIVVHVVAAGEHRRPSPVPVPEQGVPFRNRSELTRHSPSTYMPPRHHDPLDTWPWGPPAIPADPMPTTRRSCAPAEWCRPEVITPVIRGYYSATLVAPADGELPFRMAATKTLPATPSNPTEPSVAAVPRTEPPEFPAATRSTCRAPRSNASKGGWSTGTQPPRPPGSASRPLPITSARHVS